MNLISGGVLFSFHLNDRSSSRVFIDSRQERTKQSGRVQLEPIP